MAASLKQFKMHVDAFVVMQFGFDYQVAGQALAHVEQERDFGVLIDARLNLQDPDGFHSRMNKQISWAHNKSISDFGLYIIGNSL